MRARVILLLMVSTVLVSCGMVPSSFAACSQPPTTAKLESWPPNLLVGIIVNNVPGGPVSTAYTNWNKAMATPVAVCSPTFVLGSGEPGRINMSYVSIPAPTPCPAGSTCFTRGLTDFPTATFTGGGRLATISITINSSVTSNAALTEVVAHELGHTLGLGDCNYPACPVASSVMESGVTGASITINSVIGQPGPTLCDITAVLLIAPDYLCSPSGGGGGAPPPVPCLPTQNTLSANPDDDGWCTPSPIILDIDGKGYFLTSAQDGVKFDISGTGHPIQMGWTAQDADNAFLALPGVDGLIHNGKELFGNFTSQPPSKTPNGFAALAVYDQPENGGNGDGIIDSRDDIFTSLRLWIDANHDGICQLDELHTLPSLGINSISLSYTEDRKTDQYGNQFRYRVRLNPDKETEAGKTAYDVFFVTLSSPIAALRGPLSPLLTTREKQVEKCWIVPETILAAGKR